MEFIKDNIICSDSVENNVVNNSKDNMKIKKMPNEKKDIKCTNDISLLIFNNKKREILYIPNYQHYEHFNIKNYNVPELKQICKYFSFKVSGNKKVLFDRIFLYLKKCFYITKIQAFLRMCLHKCIYNLKKPYCKKDINYNNETDLYNLDPLKDIDYYNFFGIHDFSNKNYYGFSLYDFNEIIKNKKRNKGILNPYTNEKIKENVVLDFEKIYKSSIYLKYIKDFNKKIKSSKFNIKNEIIQLFQFYDELGNYTNINWFLNLNKNQLIKYYRDLMDIWYYRANLTPQIRNEICPPNGNPFIMCENWGILRHYNVNRIQEIVFNCMCKITKNSIDQDRKVIGTFYVLSALTLVSQDAASSMPWLYQSVAFS